jgi:hypothetical protein
MAVEKQFTTNDEDFEDALEAVPILWLTEEEAFAVLDTQARERLGMSGEEFLRRWRADDFSEEFKDEHHSDFVFLSLMAVPFGEKGSAVRADPRVPESGESTMAVEKQFVEAIDDQTEQMAPGGLTDEEALAVLDRQARSRLGMSGEEFLRRWRDDAFSQDFKDENHPAFAFLSVMVAPFVR